MGVIFFFINYPDVIGLTISIKVKVIYMIVFGIQQFFEFPGRGSFFEQFQCALQAELVAGQAG